MSRKWRAMGALLLMLCAVGVHAQQVPTPASTAPRVIATGLPEGLDAAEAAALVASGQDASLVVQVQARPWPARPDHHVVFACLAIDSASLVYHRRSIESDGGRSVDRPVCDGIYVHAYLGLVKYRQGDAKPVLVASFGRALDLDKQVDWESTPLVRTAAADPHADVPLLEKMEFFELADTIPIGDHEHLIGVRFGTSMRCINPSAHVRVSFGALALFQVEGERLALVHAYPMDVAKRQYAESYGAAQLSLNVLPTRTAGRSDLQIRSAADDWWQKTFVWDARARRYLPSASECKPVKAVRQAGGDYRVAVCHASPLFSGVHFASPLSATVQRLGQAATITVRVSGPVGRQSAAAAPLDWGVEGKLQYAGVDAASYALSDRFPVFGITSNAFTWTPDRVGYHQYVKRDAADRRELDLVMLDAEGRLRRIFSLRTLEVVEALCAKFETDCVPEVTTTSAVLVISPNRTAGFNDLIVRTRTVTEAYSRGTGPTSPPVQRARRFVWNGRVYEEKR